MPFRQAYLMGQDVSADVLSYGTLEQIKSALFKTSEPLLPEFELELDDSQGAYTPGGQASMLGRYHYNAPFEVLRNGISVFQGEVKGVTVSAKEKSVKIRAGNVMAKMADTRATLESTGTNPATAILSMLRAAGFGDYVDEGSFNAAAGPASAAGAVITCNFAADDGLTILEIATKIADACSLVIYSSAGLIRCQAFREYQGSGAGLREVINESTALMFGNMEYDDSAFSNRVEVNYGANLSVTLNDTRSQARDRVIRSTGIDAITGSDLAIADLDSAMFFGGQLLLRSAYRRKILNVVLGPEFDSIEIGHRHPVTNLKLGLNEEPMEAVEVRRSLTSDDISVVFVSLS